MTNEQDPKDMAKGRNVKSGASRKTVFVAGGVVAGLLVAGGAYAAIGGVNSIMDKDIAQAAPLESALFMQIDLDPSNKQKIGAMALAKKADSIAAADKDAKDSDYRAGNKEVKEIISDPFFEELDYGSEVKPFLGDKAAVAAWGDFSDNLKDAESMASNPRKALAKKNDVNVVMIYEVTNEDKAKSAAEKASSASKTKFNYLVSDGYLVIAENAAVLKEYSASMDAGNLAGNNTYTTDVESAGGNIASAWVDVSKMGIDDALKQASGVDYSAKGRVVAALSLQRDGATMVMNTMGTEPGSEKVDWHKKAEKGLDEMGNLDGESQIAFSMNGMPGLLEDVQEILSDSGEMDGVNDSVSELGKELGLELPKDWTKVVGKETAIGVNVKEDGSDGIIQMRAEGASEDVLRDIVEEMGMEANGASVKDGDGDAVLLQYSGAGMDSSDKKLSDNDQFKTALPSLDKAVMAFYMDASAFDEQDEKASEIGSFGVTVELDENKTDSTILMRWVY